MCKKVFQGSLDYKQQKLALASQAKENLLEWCGKHRELKEGWKTRFGNGEVVKLSPEGRKILMGLIAGKKLIWILLLKQKPLNIPPLKIHIHRRGSKDWFNLANVPTSRKGINFWLQFHIYVQWVRGKSSKRNQDTLGKRSRFLASTKWQPSATLKIINDAPFPTICEYYIMWHTWWCLAKSSELGSIIVISYSLSRPWVCKWLTQQAYDIVTSEQHYIFKHNYLLKKLKLRIIMKGNLSK